MKRNRLAAGVVVLAFFFVASLVADENEDGKKPILGAYSRALRGFVTDESGKPVSGAAIESMGYSGERKLLGRSAENGKFSVRSNTPGYSGETLIVTGPDGKRGSFISRYSYDRGTEKVFRVVLTPYRRTKVVVLDGDNKRIAGADVRLIAKYDGLAQGVTGENGECTLEFAADAEVDWVIAYKSGAGFDYHENYDSHPTQFRLELPEQIDLKLDGSVSVDVQVVDTAEKPVANAAATPWTIKKIGKLSSANLSGLRLGMTDEMGVATFDWIPKDLESQATFLVRHPKYYCQRPPEYRPINGEPKMPLETTVLKLAKVSGRVTYADGRPAAGIRIQGEGRGGNHYFRGHTSTEEDGTYSMDIYPGQTTILAVTEDLVGARSVTGVKLSEGEQLADQNFVLNGGTVIQGIATIGLKGAPLPGQLATLIQQANGSSLVRWNSTDRDGRYQFIVGPGVYELHLPNSEQTVTVNVDRQKEIVNDIHVDRLQRGKFTGVVVDEEGNAVPRAAVLSESSVAGHAGFTTRANTDGRFTTERWNDDMVVYAYQNVIGMAGFVSVAANDVEIQVPIRPGASISGTVVDVEGNPQVNQQIHLLIRIPDAGRGINRFAQTDEKGRFEFRAIAVGIRCTVYPLGNPVKGKAPEFEIDEAKEIDLAEPIVVQVPAAGG